MPEDSTDIGIRQDEFGGLGISEPEPPGGLNFEASPGMEPPGGWVNTSLPTNTCYNLVYVADSNARKC
jgi:hypothetical protein